MERTEILKRMRQIERLAAELAAGLNVKKTACTCCGHEKYDDWDAAQLADTLGSYQTKLRGRRIKLEREG